ncbi:hypothetical protein PsorP6_009339 [Peronosclerospora sorghi]|uniref:Uncharacterized protein n=1 Tax=Peronosclerospora sorghi TaxID=230839 RepID=A0ACC0W0C4_9STRA|nr:hypothetical protein PsorP6_009339 [Peronosclerospora sorghi]
MTENNWNVQCTLRCAHPCTPAHAVTDQTFDNYLGPKVIDGVLNARAKLFSKRVFLKPISNAVNTLEIVIIRKVYDHHRVTEITQCVGIDLGATTIQTENVRVCDDPGRDGVSENMEGILVRMQKLDVNAALHFNLTLHML